MSVQMNSLSYINQMISGLNKQNKNTANIEKLDISATVNVTAVNKTDTERTVEDVKKEFYDYLDSLPVSSGLGKTPINVTISEGAFERMLEDPEFEQRMKDLCKRDLCDPGWDSRGILGPPTYMHINITDNPNNELNSEYVGSSYNYGTGSNYEAETENSFWSRRTKKDDGAEKAKEKRSEEKRQLEKIQEKRREEQEMLDHILERSREQKEFFSSSWEISASKKIGSYVQSAATAPQAEAVSTEA